MKILLLLALCFAGNIAYAQTDTLENASDYEEEPIYSVVEVMPEFPGGFKAMIKFLEKNSVYPKNDMKAGEEGLSVIQFIVEKDGSLSNIKIAPGMEKRATADMHKEAIRVVKLMPTWKPGKQSGKLCRVKFTAPVRFSLNN